VLSLPHLIKQTTFMVDALQKRFIAGAICPQCHLMDKIVVYTMNERPIAECVRCGYQQQTIDQKKSDTINKNGKKRKVLWLKPKVNAKESSD